MFILETLIQQRMALKKNIRSFVRIEANQSAYLWVGKVYDYKKSKNLLTNIILENKKEFNIIFIQEPS